MGVVLAKFRKERTTEELLEKLDEQIQVLESYMHNTEEKKKRFVSNFLAFSIGVYVIALIIVYFLYFPTTWKETLLYFVPLLLVPFVIFRLRRIFTWYFQRKLNKNSGKLIALRAEKRKILEQVMDKETYKVAVNLLARFADKSNNSKPTFSLTPRPNASTSQLRLRNNSAMNIQSPQFSQLSNLHSLVTSNISLTPRRPALPTSNRLGADENYGDSLSTNQNLNSNSPDQTSNLNTPRLSTGMLNHQTPFPIINHQDKTVFERIVDVLIGDGPQDRFAMICKECCAHNGMAPKEEFDYAAFRCAFCNVMNPARKARPIAPRLSFNLEQRRNSTDTSSSSYEDEAVDKDMVRNPSFLYVSEDKQQTQKTTAAPNTARGTTDDSRDESDSIENDLFDNNNETGVSLLLQKAEEDVKLHSNLMDILKKENFSF